MKIILIAFMLAIATTLSLADESWTGFIAGIQIGTAEVSVDGSDNGNAALGAHVGYLHDFGGYVLGGELSYDAGAELVTEGNAQKVDTVRLKLKGGHVFGRTLLYGVVGYANIDGASISNDGYSVGVGASFRATDNILIGAEYLRDVSDSSGGDVETDSVSLRLSYLF